jgi:protein tyrosine phosphatase (PTP) superfamily phosphohydrolase (DUF442 family)
MSTLQRRLIAQEQTAWDRRKRQIVRAEFAPVARDRQWTADQFEREVQAALEDFKRMEPALTAMCQQGKTAVEVAAWIAAEMGIDVDDLLAEAERSSLIAPDGRW